MKPACIPGNLTRRLFSIQPGGVLAGLLIIVSGLLPPATLAADAAPEPASTAERLRQLEDREAIRELLMEYGRTLDARDFAAFAGLFAADGEWIGGFGGFRGPAAIQAEMERQIGTASQQPGSSNHHVIINESIAVNGDTASARTKWFFVITGEGNRPLPVYLGHYDDQLVRVGEGWKFKRRLVYGDIPFNDPLAGQ